MFFMAWRFRHMAQNLENERMNELYLKMGDSKPPLKTDEQHPLLKVGDITHGLPSKSAVPDWQVTCKKNPRYSKWLEFLSACWMALMICGISFWVFHALGVSLLRRQQLVIVQCDDAKPASNVYYHQIVPKGSQIPFTMYIEYLAHISKKYPLLNLNVIFLVDDVNPEMRKRNFPVYYPWFHNYKLDDVANEAYLEFKRKYQNVNVTVISLSKFMAKTPLKYKWRYIPQSHLMFYARVFSVWQNGGIGMDLVTFNNDYHSGFIAHSRIDAILSQHNDGINPEVYTKTLNKIDHDEASAFFNMFTGIISQLLNDTRSFLNRTLPVLSRSHRNKRETQNYSDIPTVAMSSNDPKDFYNVDGGLIPTPKEVKNDKTESMDVSKISTTNQENSSTIAPIKTSTSKENASETQQVVLVYDFSIISNGNPFLPSKHKSSNVLRPGPHLLSIDTEGTFIAASSRLHPFLGHLTSAAGYFGMHPKIAIQDALLSQCSGFFKDDVYCNNIFVI